MSAKTVKAALSRLPSPLFLSSEQRACLPPNAAVWQSEDTKRFTPKALPQPVLQASSFPFQACSPGSRSAPTAGTAPPIHCTWFRFTSPLSLLSASPPPTQSDCHAPACPTRKLANRTAKSAPQPFGQTRHPSLPAAVLAPQQ